jgi:ABC-type multidrug transport system fused ATPase/permease subunit
MFFEQVKKESYDFNIMMFFSFLGDSLLKATEFRISISIFGAVIALTILNILAFSFIDYDISDNSFSFIKILFIFLIWLALSIGVGASALLPQQVIIDSNALYNKYLIKLNEETEKKREELKIKFEQQKIIKVKGLENEEEQIIKILNPNEKENKELKEKEKENKEKNEENEKNEEKEENDDNEKNEEHDKNENKKEKKIDSTLFL